MMKTAFLTGALALAALSAPAMAQATMTPDQVGMQPMTGVSATDYAKLAADSDQFEIMSSKVALSKSKRADVKAFANEMIRDHTQTTKTLQAALKNPDRTIALPQPAASSDTMSKVAMLKKTPKATFDQVYLQQQLEGHQKAWALHDGYATDGTDPALKQVASTAVPIVEHHLSEVKAMQAGQAPTGM